MTGDNVLQLLADYTSWKYEDEVLRSIDECPYPLNFTDEELVYKQVLTWFMLERTKPTTGKTVLEEFVEQFIKNDDALAEKALGMGDLITDTFNIVSCEDNIIVLEGETSANRFTVWVIPEQSEYYIPGKRVKGRIFRWGDMYRFAGITNIEKSDKQIERETGIVTPELMMKWYGGKFLKMAESIVVDTRSSLASILNKLPWTWIDDICSSLLVSKRGKKREKVKRIVAILDSQYLKDVVRVLDKDAHEALMFVVEKGGMVRYSVLVKKFTDDTCMWWEKTPPSSAVGTLRRHGLLVVGKMPRYGRLYKVAIIPREVIQRLYSLRITSK